MNYQKHLKKVFITDMGIKEVNRMKFKLDTETMFIGAIVGIMIFALVGCDDKLPKEVSESNNYIVESELNNTAWIPIYTLIDKETGVEYIIIRGGNGIAITPRYDVNGELKRR